MTHIADKIGRALDARTAKSESAYCAGEEMSCYLRSKFGGAGMFEDAGVVLDTGMVPVNVDGDVNVTMYPPAENGGYDYMKRIETSSLYDATLAVKQGYWVKEMSHETCGQDYLVRMITCFNEIGQTVFVQLMVYDRRKIGWPAPIEYRAARNWNDMIFKELRPAYDALGWRLPIDDVA